MTATREFADLYQRPRVGVGSRDATGDLDTVTGGPRSFSGRLSSPASSGDQLWIQTTVPYGAQLYIQPAASVGRFTHPWLITWPKL